MKKFLSMLFVFVIIVNIQIGFCDAGPKPSLTIEVVNVEGSTCIVDLLVQKGPDSIKDPWIVYEGEHTENYESLKRYKEDGWMDGWLHRQMVCTR